MQISLWKYSSRQWTPPIMVMTLQRPSPTLRPVSYKLTLFSVFIWDPYPPTIRLAERNTCWPLCWPIWQFFKRLWLPFDLLPAIASFRESENFLAHSGTFIRNFRFGDLISFQRANEIELPANNGPGTLIVRLCQRNYQVQFGGHGTFTFIVPATQTKRTFYGQKQSRPLCFEKQFSLEWVMPIFLLASANEPKSLSQRSKISKQFQRHWMRFGFDLYGKLKLSLSLTNRGFNFGFM